MYFLLANIDKAKTAFKLVEVKVGTDETGNVTPSQAADRYLTSKGVPHTLTLVPGGIHSWISWRGYFRDYMQEIFKD